MDKLLLIGIFDGVRYNFAYKCKKCLKSFEISRPRNKSILHSRLCRLCANRSKVLKCKIFNGPIYLINALTNEEVFVDNITNFVNSRPELEEVDRYHFSDVLNGKRLHHKGWYLKDGKKFDKTKVKEGHQILLKRAQI